MMEKLESLALKYIDGRLLVLDQRQLPGRETWHHCTSPDQMCDIIRTLQVRGAPLIGVAAALSLADYALTGASGDAILSAADRLLASRPTAVNLRAALRRLLPDNTVPAAEEIARRAAALFHEDRQLCENMSRYGAQLIDDGDRILTHCNTGRLVTTGKGTALGAILQAWEDGKHIHVYVDETRPLLQGARLTTWELARAGVPHTLICDNMAGALMARGDIDKVMLGSDRIAANGDVANKIGTYGAAVLAHYHQLPFYVVAPYTTVDLSCASGADIPVEQRDSGEVRGFTDSETEVTWAPPATATANPAFDVTPAALVTALVLDRGVFTREELATGALTRLLQAEPDAPQGA